MSTANQLAKCFICAANYKIMISFEESLRECQERTVEQILENLHFISISDTAKLRRFLCLICVAKVQSCFELKIICCENDKKSESATNVPTPMIPPLEFLNQNTNGKSGKHVVKVAEEMIPMDMPIKMEIDIDEGIFAQKTEPRKIRIKIPPPENLDQNTNGKPDKLEIKVAEETIEEPSVPMEIQIKTEIDIDEGIFAQKIEPKKNKIKIVPPSGKMDQNTNEMIEQQEVTVDKKTTGEPSATMEKKKKISIDEGIFAPKKQSKKNRTKIVPPSENMDHEKANKQEVQRFNKQEEKIKISTDEGIFAPKKKPEKNRTKIVPPSENMNHKKVNKQEVTVDKKTTKESSATMEKKIKISTDDGTYAPKKKPKKNRTQEVPPSQNMNHEKPNKQEVTVDEKTAEEPSATMEKKIKNSIDDETYPPNKKPEKIRTKIVPPSETMDQNTNQKSDKQEITVDAKTTEEPSATMEKKIKTSTDEEIFAPKKRPKKNKTKDKVKKKRKPRNTEERPFDCLICHKKFKLKHHLQAHTLIHTGEKRHVCDVCSKPFTIADALKKHQLIHSGEKPHLCDVCSKSFNTIGNLMAHQRIHSGEKPYVCDVCKKAFRYAGNLVDHKLTHTGDRPHACNMCTKLFAYGRDLKKHKMIHTGEKPHACDICNKLFSRASNLKTHKLAHSGERPFVCDVCDKTFSVINRLWRHQLIHANKKPSSGILKPHKNIDKC